MSSSPLYQRKIFIAGNWKSNGDRAFVNKHCMFLSGAKINSKTTELCLAPSNIYLLTCKKFLSHLFHISSQDISQFDSGPFTGEISAKQIKDLDIDWTIIAQSERRKFFNENETIIGKKIEKALENNLNIIFCIGENKEEKENNKSFEVIKMQLETLFKNIKNNNNWGNIVIAYEPSWENEMNTVMTNEQVQGMHEYIRGEIIKKFGKEIGNKIRIIFGGNVDENNCNSLIILKDVDGFLVGEPSINTSFNNIIESAKFKI